MISDMALPMPEWYIRRIAKRYMVVWIFLENTILGQCFPRIILAYSNSMSCYCSSNFYYKCKGLL